jgi:hypothetical protein
VRGQAASSFGLIARHISPADLLRVFQDSGPEGLVFGGGGHNFLQGLEVDLNLRSHQLPALLEEVVVVWCISREHSFRDAALPQVGLQFAKVGDATVFLFSTLTLLYQFLEIHRRRLVADGDVDFGLGERVVRNLVVASAVQSLTLEMVSRMEMMHVTFI